MRWFSSQKLSPNSRYVQSPFDFIDVITEQQQSHSANLTSPNVTSITRAATKTHLQLANDVIYHLIIRGDDKEAMLNYRNQCNSKRLSSSYNFYDVISRPGGKNQMFGSRRRRWQIYWHELGKYACAFRQRSHKCVCECGEAIWGCYESFTAQKSKQLLT